MSEIQPKCAQGAPGVFRMNSMLLTVFQYQHSVGAVHRHVQHKLFCNVIGSLRPAVVQDVVSRKYRHRDDIGWFGVVELCERNRTDVTINPLAVWNRQVPYYLWADQAARILQRSI